MTTSHSSTICNTCNKEVTIPHHHGRHSFRNYSKDRICEDGSRCIVEDLQSTEKPIGKKVLEEMEKESMQTELQSTEKCKGLEYSSTIFSCNVNSELCILHNCSDTKGGCNCELQIPDTERDIIEIPNKETKELSQTCCRLIAGLIKNVKDTSFTLEETDTHFIHRIELHLKKRGASD